MSEIEERINQLKQLEFFHKEFEQAVSNLRQAWKDGKEDEADVYMKQVNLSNSRFWKEARK